MDRRTLLFIAISVAIIVLYQELVLRNLAPPPAEQAPSAQVETTGPAESVAARTPAETGAIDGFVGSRAPAALDEPPVAQPLEEELIRVETDLYRAVFTTVGGRLKDFRLKAVSYTHLTLPTICSV